MFSNPPPPDRTRAVHGRVRGGARTANSHAATGGTLPVKPDTGTQAWRRLSERSFGVLAFAALTALTYPIARYRMFMGFAHYDDEGYMLMSLKSFLHHGWHYDGVDGYGPFYYEFWGAVYTLFGIPVDHDGSRAATMVVWLLTSLLIGLCTWRVTGSIILGLATQLSAFEALFSLVAEPMHPGGIIVLLLAAILACSCFVRDRPSPFPVALLGGAVMALILVKINIGVFALAAVALVCVLSYPALAGRRWLRPLVEAGFVALPLPLMSAKLGEAWVRHYALHVCAAALAVVIALRARPVARRDSRELWWLGGGFLAVGLTVPLVLIAAGTSPSAIIDGVILLPLRFPGILTAPFDQGRSGNVVSFLDLLAVAEALGYWQVARHRAAGPSRTHTWLIAALSILIGLFMAFAVIISITRFTEATTLLVPFYFRWGLLAFAWVALIEPPGADQRTRFVRLLLPPLAVLQALHAYPMAAASHAFWSTLLLIPVGALCIANGVRWITWSRSGDSARRVPLKLGAVAASVVLIVLVAMHLKVESDYVRAAYDRAVPLGLSGAQKVRVSPEDAANFRGVVAEIDTNCQSFVMLPGMNSFYLWTRQEPPPGYDSTGWATALDEASQQRAVEAIRSLDGLCLLENAALARAYAAEGSKPGPRERYLHHGFAPIATFGDYQLLKRDAAASRP